VARNCPHHRRRCMRPATAPHSHPLIPMHTHAAMTALAALSATIHAASTSSTTPGHRTTHHSHRGALQPLHLTFHAPPIPCATWWPLQAGGNSHQGCPHYCTPHITAHICHAFQHLCGPLHQIACSRQHAADTNPGCSQDSTLKFMPPMPSMLPSQTPHASAHTAVINTAVPCMLMHLYPLLHLSSRVLHHPHLGHPRHTPLPLSSRLRSDLPLSLLPCQHPPAMPICQAEHFFSFLIIHGLIFYFIL